MYVCLKPRAMQRILSYVTNGHWIKMHVFSEFSLRGVFDVSVQFSSVAQSCPTLCDSMNHSTPGLPVHYQLPEFTQTHANWVGDAIQPSHACLPLLLLPPIPPSIRVFSSESTLRMRWPKYWSFSSSIIPSKEIPIFSVEEKRHLLVYCPFLLVVTFKKLLSL